MADHSASLTLEDIDPRDEFREIHDSANEETWRQRCPDGATDARYTFADVIDRTERLAAGLQHIGVQTGDVVCIISPNNLEYHISFYAVTLVTAVFQTVNHLFPADDIKRMTEECNSKYVITVPALLPKLKEALADFTHIKMIVFGEAEGCVSFESLLDPKHCGYTTPPCDPKTTVAALLSSSGTTGFPKPVKLSHYGLAANIIQMNSTGVYGKGERCIMFVPMFHAYGLHIFGSTAKATGACIVVMARFFPEEYMRLIQKHKPSTLHTVPPIMVMFAKHPKVTEYDLSSVNAIVCGAAPLSEDIQNQAVKRLNNPVIIQGYGMTEVSETHLNTREHHRHNAAGKLLPLMELKVVDVATEKVLGPRQSGEIYVRGPQVALGYLNRELETQEVFLNDGWLRTGDIGYEDEDGYLFIVDRLKELIKYKGYQVAPATLEDILLRHDCVTDVGVIGVADDDAGEVPKAFVVKKAGKDVTEEELVAFVAGLVAPHMKLRGGVEFMTEIPRSPSGKILRRILRDSWKNKAFL